MPPEGRGIAFAVVPDRRNTRQTAYPQIIICSSSS